MLVGNHSIREQNAVRAERLLLLFKILTLLQVHIKEKEIGNEPAIMQLVHQER